VCKTLRDEHLAQILEIELGMVQQRVLMAAGTNRWAAPAVPARHALGRPALATSATAWLRSALVAGI
jgi:hypothetical protein